MTAQTMDCGGFRDRLMAYLEDETDAVGRAAVERHAGTCGGCGAMLADLRRLRSDAAALPELAPSRDLWAGIAARIEAPVVPIGAPAVAAPRPWGRRLRTAGVLAASLAGAAVLGYLIGTRPDAAGPLQLSRQDSSAAPSGSASAVAPAGAQIVVASLTADYDREVARLTQLILERRDQMDPATVAIIEKNLRVIDAAIADARQAIARDPASRFLMESLNQSLRMKVELMRTAAMLPSRA